MEASISFIGSTTKPPNLSSLTISPSSSSSSSNVLRRLPVHVPVPALSLKKVSVFPRISHRNHRLIRAQCSDGLRPDEDDGFVLEDVPHLTTFLPDLPVKLLLCLFSAYVLQIMSFYILKGYNFGFHKICF